MKNMKTDVKMKQRNLCNYFLAIMRSAYPWFRTTWDGDHMWSKSICIAEMQQKIRFHSICAKHDAFLERKCSQRFSLFSRRRVPDRCDKSTFTLISPAPVFTSRSAGCLVLLSYFALIGIWFSHPVDAVIVILMMSINLIFCINKESVWLFETVTVSLSDCCSGRLFFLQYTAIYRLRLVPTGWTFPSFLGKSRHAALK